MQNYPKHFSELLCASTIFLVESTLYATNISPIDITLSSGFTSNIISTTPDSTSLVEYSIHDLIGRPPSRTWIWAAPIPPYITRVTSIHEPDCSFFNQNSANPNAFSLPPNETCYFALQVNGASFANFYQGIPITYRPLFTNSNGVSYGPCLSDALSITLKQQPPIVTLLVAAGQYISDSSIFRPLLVQSADSGVTWVYPDSLTTPTNGSNEFLNRGIFFGASCVENTCIAVGKGEDVNLASNPILAITQDRGASWNYPTIIPPIFTPANTYPYDPNRGYNFFSSINCSENLCVTGGSYADTGNTIRPFAAVSQNSGTNWTFPDSITSPMFINHPYQFYGSFNSTTCSGSNCILVGGYYSDVGRPLLASSQNFGTTWKYSESITTPLFTPTNTHSFLQDGQFSTASCYQNICIAGGSYVSEDNIRRPLLASSQNAGLNWIYPNIVTAPIFIPNNTHSFNSDGFISSVSCYGTHCVAVGDYRDRNLIQRPLLGLSKDSGITWTFLDALTAPLLLAHPFAQGTFSSITCYNDKTCIAVGQYIDNMATQRPLLAQSQDLGITWSFIESITAPAFTPSNSNPFSREGSLLSVSCNINNECLASGSYIDINDIARPLVALSKDSGITWTYPDSVTSPVFSPNNTYPFTASDNLDATGASILPWVQLRKLLGS